MLNTKRLGLGVVLAKDSGDERTTSQRWRNGNCSCKL
jgi:hypothetical protein